MIMYFTPELESTVVLLASPLASAVALWGMRAPPTSNNAIAIKKKTFDITSANETSKNTGEVTLS
jgi:hypothetical protein